MKLACLLLVGVGLLACGSDKEDDPLSSANGFCQEWSKRACSKAVVNLCGAPDEEDCREAQAEFCEKLVPATLYSQAGAEVCLTAVEKAYKDGSLTAEERDTVRLLGDPCDMMLSGKGEKDDDCDENSDCDREGGFDCVIPLGATEGTCQRPNKVMGGDPCEDDSDVCGPGLYCNESDDGKYCLRRRDVGKACSELEPCALGLNCESAGAEEPLLCTAKLANNKMGCEVDSDCATDICLRNGDRSICSDSIALNQLEPICDDLHSN